MGTQMGISESLGKCTSLVLSGFWVPGERWSWLWARHPASPGPSVDHKVEMLTLVTNLCTALLTHPESAEYVRKVRIP